MLEKIFVHVSGMLEKKCIFSVYQVRLNRNVFCMCKACLKVFCFVCQIYLKRNVYFECVSDA